MTKTLSLTRYVLVALGVMLAAYVVLAALPAGAQTAKEQICEGIGLTTTAGGNNCAQTGTTSVDSVVRTVVNILSIVVGVVAVIMIIIGGLKYITSTGDSAKVSSAKNTILYAIVGLVIVALAQVIVRYVMNSVAP